MKFAKITLVGIGLLGGSLGLAVRKRRLAERVTGYVRREAAAEECRRLNVADQVTLDLESAVRDADLVVLCTPIAQMRPLMTRMVPALKPGALVTDVGSVKESVVRELEPLAEAAGALFIGSHPMAGTEKTGVGAAKTELYDGAVCVLTPTPRSDSAALERLESFWRAAGMRTIRLDPARHDQLTACCSHLPHVVAAGLANFVLDPAHPAELPLLCASGFRDTTRIASGSPEMWRDIALANTGALAGAMDRFMDELTQFRRALAAGDAEGVAAFFERAKQRRDRWCHAAASRSPE